MAPKKIEAYRQKRKRTKDTQLEHESEESQPQPLQVSSKVEPSQSLNKKVLFVKKISTGRALILIF